MLRGKLFEMYLTHQENCGTIDSLETGNMYVTRSRSKSVQIHSPCFPSHFSAKGLENREKRNKVIEAHYNRNPMKKIRPDSCPRAIVFPLTAEQEGRTSGGSHNTGFPFKAIQSFCRRNNSGFVSGKTDI